MLLPGEVCPGFHVQDLYRLCVESAHVVLFEDCFMLSLVWLLFSYLKRGPGENTFKVIVGRKTLGSKDVFADDS